MMNLLRFDPQLLFLFHILYQEKNVTRAAERMVISQPGLTHKLNKLREEWQDPLFIKVSRGLAPTPKAHELAPKVAKLIQDLERFYQDISITDFMLKHDKITVFTTDYMEQKLLPDLITLMQNTTPNVVLITRNTQGKLPKKELESGEADIAIAGFYQNLPETFRQQKLIEEPFVVVARKNHNKIRDTLTLDNYIQCDHIVTTLNGDLHSHIDDMLHLLGHKRKVILGVSSFLSLAEMIAKNNCITTCLKSIALNMIHHHPELTYYPVPLEIKPVEIMQIWHERTQQDPLRSWFRKSIKNLLTPTEIQNNINY